MQFYWKKVNLGMEVKENTEKMVLVPQSWLLALVAEKLKGKELFPESNAEAKRLLQNAKITCTF
jgi:hypothetical protein